MSDTVANDPNVDGGVAPHDVTVALKLAEAFPSVPLRALFAELRHAESAVAVGGEERAEIIVRLVEARLGQYVEGQPDAPRTPAQR